MSPKDETLQQWFSCGNCHALGWGGPVHGEGNPCPLKMDVDRAYVEMVDAQRMSYVRSGASLGDLMAAIRKMTGADAE